MAVISKVTTIDNVTYDIKDSNAVPKTRTINGKPLTNNITLDAEDVGAMPEDAEFEIGYNDASTVGVALTGTAVTGVPNYTPSGDVILNMETKKISTNAEISYSYSNYCLHITGIKMTFENVGVPTGASFDGSSVEFIIKEKGVL